MSSLVEGVDRDAALARLGERVKGLDADEQMPYLFLCLAILGSNAPDVLTFVMDRADERVES